MALQTTPSSCVTDIQNLDTGNMIWAQTTWVHNGLLAQRILQQLFESHRVWNMVAPSWSWRSSLVSITGCRPWWLPKATCTVAPTRQSSYGTSRPSTASMSSRCQWQCLLCHHKESLCLGHVGEIYPLVGHQVQVGVEPDGPCGCRVCPDSDLNAGWNQSLQHILQSLRVWSINNMISTQHRVPGPALHSSVDSTVKVWTRQQRIQAGPAIDRTKLAFAFSVGQVSRLMRPGSCLPALCQQASLCLALSLLLPGKCLGPALWVSDTSLANPPSCPTPDGLWPFTHLFYCF